MTKTPVGNELAFSEGQSLRPLGTREAIDLANAMPIAVAYIDHQARYRFVNEAYERMFEVDRSTLKDVAMRDYLGESVFAKIQSYVERALTGESVQYEQSLTLKNARTYDLKVHYVPDLNDKDQVIGFFATLLDITEYNATIRLLKSVHQIIHQGKIDDKIDRLLALGCAHLGLPIGIVSRVENDTYDVEYVWTDMEGISPGDTFTLWQTYCVQTLAADDVLATARAGEDDRFKGHPCYDNFALESYIGVPLTINDQVYGTLNFSGPKPRERGFNTLDMELLRVMGDAVRQILVKLQEAENQARERQSLSRRAYTDGLTGLANRAALDETLEALREQFRQHASPVSFAVLDLDHFKQINDQYGHPGGDVVLTSIAAALRSRFRQGDTVGRLGGEEFLVILRGADVTAAATIMEAVRAHIESLEIAIEGMTQPVKVTTSVGVAELQGQDLRRPCLYRRADEALYMAKREGRNRVVTV